MDNKTLFTQELESYIQEKKKDEKNKSLLFWFLLGMALLVIGIIATYFFPEKGATEELAWFAMAKLS